MTLPSVVSLIGDARVIIYDRYMFTVQAAGSYVLKPFLNKLACLSFFKHFIPSVIFVCRKHNVLSGATMVSFQAYTQSLDEGTNVSQEQTLQLITPDSKFRQQKILKN